MLYSRTLTLEKKSGIYIDTACPYSDAGSWLFCGRKWIDPADPDGRDKLDIHHFNLCVLFPPFAAACPHDRFVDAIATVAESWSQPMRAVADAGRCRTLADFAPDSPPSYNPISLMADIRSSADSSVEATGRAPVVGSGDMRAVTATMHGSMVPGRWPGWPMADRVGVAAQLGPNVSPAVLTLKPFSAEEMNRCSSCRMARGTRAGPNRGPPAALADQGTDTALAWLGGRLRPPRLEARLSQGPPDPRQ